MEMRSENLEVIEVDDLELEQLNEDELRELVKKQRAVIRQIKGPEAPTGKVAMGKVQSNTISQEVPLSDK